MSTASDMRAFVIQSKTEGKPGQVYYPAGVQKVDTPSPKDGEVVSSRTVEETRADEDAVGQDACCCFESQRSVHAAR